MLASSIAILILGVLLSMNRVWMYYFIPSFPFAAVLGGWLVSGWVHGAIHFFRNRRRQGSAPAVSAPSLSFGLALFLCFVVAIAMSPRLEHHLSYYEKAMEKSPESRKHTYTC